MGFWDIAKRVALGAATGGLSHVKDIRDATKKRKDKGTSAKAPEAEAQQAPAPGGPSIEQLMAIDPSISRGQWEAQMAEQQAEGGFDPNCPPDRPFKSGRPIQGAAGPVDNCVEKRENCPPGFRVIGSDDRGDARCLPGDAREFGGPGGGGGRGGPGGGPGGDAGMPGGNMWGGYDDMTGQAMSQLYGTPFYGPEEGMLRDYYAGIMGKKWDPTSGQYVDTGSTAQLAAATGAEQNALRESIEGQVQQVMQTMPPGGQRDKMIADLRAQQQSLAAQSRQGAIQGATAGLTDLYGRRLDVAGNVLGQGTERFGIETTRRGQDIGFDIAQLEDKTRRELGLGELGLQRERFGFETGTAFPWEQKKFMLEQKQRGQEGKSAQQQSRRAGTMSALGTVASIGGTVAIAL